MNPNSRRRYKSLLPNSENRTPGSRVPSPAVARRRPVGKAPGSVGKAAGLDDKATGSAEFFADFLAAFMTLSPDKLADWE